jgi:CheY-like chemotaxis protein
MPRYNDCLDIWETWTSPNIPAIPPEAALTGQCGRNGGLAEAGNPAEILLVEDRTSDVELMKEALQECHSCHHLHVVRNGEEALAFLYRQGKYERAPRPHLILLDLNLPRLSGHEVLAAIKADPILKLLPVVVLTTSTTAQDILQSYELHANCCITKPADIDQFIEVVQVTLNFWLSFVSLPLATDNY